MRDPSSKRLLAEIAKGEATIERRRAAVPAVSYPPQLPVSARRDDLLDAIADNQVVIVAGETGSGKTTQLPKICLELGRGVRGAIAHTQPRRLAARTVAERIAEELSVPLGEAVGYAVRFSNVSQRDTLVRLVTDGLLLAEIQHDRLLAPLRHGHRRRGARAQPEHRLPARLPAPPAARAPGPQAHHHERDDRPGALQPPLRRRTGRRGLRPHVSRRGAPPAAERGAVARRRRGRAGRPRPRPDRRDRRRRRGAAARRARATCSSSSPASARSATRRRR